MGKKNEQNKIQTRSQKSGKTWKPSPSLEPFLMLKTKIWAKDSHGLFDYEASAEQYQNENKKIYPFRKKIQKSEKPCKQLENESRLLICRTKDCKTEIIDLNSAPNQKAPSQFLGVCQVIAQRNKRKVNFKIRTALKLENLSSALEREAQKQRNKIQNQIFRQKSVVPKINEKDLQIKVFNPLICPFTVTKRFFKGNTNLEGYPLRPGNIIKFGRVQYVVTQLKTDKQFISLRNTTELKDISSYEGVFEVPHRQDELDHQSKSEGYVPTCKVCLCHEQIDDNVLISPCKCKGYCGVIHIDCLKQWINNKVKKQTQDLVKSYNFNKFECEICKAPFPQAIKIGGKKIQMMGIEKPDKPYIIIESINPPRSLLNNNVHHRQEERCLHAISTDQERRPLKIGRGHACDIRISDISVSRAHAQIQFSQNRFLIKDDKSKFGTLVLFDEQFDMSQKHPLMIQSGRCLYEIIIGKQRMEEENEGATQSENEQAVQNQQNQGN